MAIYSNELRDNIIARVLPPNNESIAKLSREGIIHEQTLRKWGLSGDYGDYRAPKVP